MTRSAVALLALLVFAAVSLTLSAWAGRRTHNAADFTVASRRLGAWLTALGFSANALGAWLLLLICAAAFRWGASAVWLWVGAAGGCAVSVFYIGPRLRSAAIGQRAHTVGQLLGADAGDRLQPLVVRSAVLIGVVALTVQIAAALRLVYVVLTADVGLAATSSMLLLVSVIAVAVFAGGVRGAAAHEAGQIVVFVAVGVLLIAGAVVGVGGWSQVAIAVAALDPVWADPFAGKQGVVAIALAAGGAGLGLAMCGQPQALNRFIAVRDERALRRSQWTALLCVAMSCALALAVGWGANLLYGGLDRPELASFEIGNRLLPPWLSACFAAALIAALVASIAGPLFAISTMAAVDLKRIAAQTSAPWMKTIVVFAACIVAFIGVSTPDEVLDHAIFAFTTLGAVYGPLVLVRLSGKRTRPGSMLGAMWSAFALSVIFHLLPDAPGDFLERVLPFVAALGVALSGGERRRNPDRADRAQETVHDRIPI